MRDNGRKGSKTRRKRIRIRRKKEIFTLSGEEESEDEEKYQRPFKSEEESDDSQVHIILFNAKEK